MKHLLRINMESQTTLSETVDQKYALFGGRSLIAQILNQEVDARVVPLGSENKLILCPGLFVDTAAPCSGRISVGGKSPLTKTIKEANAGGTMAKRMAALDLHGLVLEGQPPKDKWFVLVVDASGVEFLSAQTYLGMNNYQLGEELRKKMGSDISIASIGLAGERGYLNASIQFTDLDGHPSRAAARGGLGALMGSKGVKAIVFKDPETTDWAYVAKANFVAANKAYGQAILAHPFSGQGLPALGTALLVNVTNEMGILPTHNFSKGRWEHAEETSGERIAELQAERGGKQTHACQRGCTIRCSQVYNDKEGKYLTSGFEYETIGLFGANCGIRDIDVIARLDRLCDDLGVDTMDAACALGMCMEAGLIAFGDAAGALRLAQEMIEGTELGRILGNGTEATGRHLGVKRIPTVKGQAMAAYDPRGLKGTGVTYATSPMGADHTAGCTVGDQSLDGRCKDGQVELSRNLQIMMTVFDSLGMCIFSGFCCEDPKVLGYLIDMAAAKFGGDWDVNRLMGLGVQTLLLEKQFNKAAGFTEKDDRLPQFMYTEVLETAGTTFDLTTEDLAKTLAFGESV
ncbi:aldehyde ferredoxin oxidoreductase C-terminal domain-containing protein [Geopsychrobacter electrodiphilus]|uniref:aldehyde ferredoxin oxidoreductase C-terminal domain-containing protein n=1 Tax=Geopsychrobacter electrodiphilus TaxID=225196 RepID=UPI000367CDAB|nr:aldehyde ferredoxin oxidoreductase C-terminal domain-containing protein [Geopsychrobacter electrodiphilus]